MSGLNLGGNTLDDYYYANENGRLFSTLTLPIDYDRENQDEEINAKLGVKVDSRWEDPENENYRTVDFFNPGEEEKTIECSVTDIELENGEYKIKDFWSGEEFTGNNIIASLKPHESRLFLIEKA